MSFLRPAAALLFVLFLLPAACSTAEDAGDPLSALDTAASALRKIDGLMFDIEEATVLASEKLEEDLVKQKSALLEKMKRSEQITAAVAREYEAVLASEKSPLGIAFTSDRRRRLLPCLEDLLMASNPDSAVKAMRAVMLDAKKDKEVRSVALQRLAADPWSKWPLKLRQTLVSEALHDKDLQSTAVGVIGCAPDEFKAASDEEKAIIAQVALGPIETVLTVRSIFAAGFIGKDEYEKWLRVRIAERKASFDERRYTLDELDKLGSLAKQEKSILAARIKEDEKQAAIRMQTWRQVETNVFPLEQRKKIFAYLKKIDALSSNQILRLEEVLRNAKDDM